MDAENAKVPSARDGVSHRLMVLGGQQVRLHVASTSGYKTTASAGCTSLLPELSL